MYEVVRCVGLQLAIDIGDEVRGQNTFLSNMVSHLSIHTLSLPAYHTAAILRMKNLIQQVASLPAVCRGLKTWAKLGIIAGCVT